MAPGLELSKRDDKVVTAVLDHGSGNLVTSEICEALTAYLLDPPVEAHVLVLTARGPNFCLGRERRATTPATLRQEVGALVALNRALRATRLVTVAQVQGPAAGFGVGLAALCDVAVAAPSARFWFPEVDMNLAPAVVLAWLPRLAGSKPAFLLTATGREIPATRAAEMGLVTTVAPTDDTLEQTVWDAVADLTKHDRTVHSEIKSFLRTSADLSEDQAYDLAAERLIVASMDAHGQRPANKTTSHA